MVNYVFFSLLCVPLSVPLTAVVLCIVIEENEEMLASSHNEKCYFLSLEPDFSLEIVHFFCGSYSFVFMRNNDEKFKFSLKNKSFVSTCRVSFPSLCLSLSLILLHFISLFSYIIMCNGSI